MHGEPGGGGGGFVPASGCEACGCMSFNSAWFDAFGVLLCDRCKGEERLISKSTAKATYLLSDKELSKLGSLRKPNPQHKTWTPMQLYMQSQVEEVAQRKHGSVEELEQLRHDRLDARLKDRMSKRKAATAAAAAEQQQGQAAAEGQAQGAAPPPPGGESAAQRRVRARLQEAYGGGTRAAGGGSARGQTAEAAGGSRDGGHSGATTGAADRGGGGDEGVEEI